MSGYRGPGIGFDSQQRVILSYTGFDRDGNTQGFAARLEQGDWRYYQVTDWAERFDMNGGGSLYFPYNYGSLHPKSEGLLSLRVMNEPMFGDGADYEYTVDEKTLRIVGGPVRIYPKELETPPPSTVPLEARLVGPPERMLRWFTLPAGRDGDADYASQAPKDIWLELVELEKNPDLTPPAYVPSVDRDATWNMVIGCVDLERAPELAKADALYNAGDFTGAYRTFQAYWHRRVKEVLADPDITPRWEEWPAPPSARTISDYKKHRYEFAGLRRTLPYDVEFWWPFQPGVLERWDGLSHTTNATTAIGPDELNQVSTLARWFNDFNRLRHLTGLGTSYADTHDFETARYWAHDFYDWLYDNPVPDAAHETGPWGFDVTADRFCDALMPGLYQFVDSESMRDEEFFGLVRSIVDHTRYLTTAIVTTGASSFERQEAAEMLHWWASVFSEFSYSPELARNAMEVMVSFGK